MAALRDFPILDRLQNSAARFLGVGTAAESAFALVVVHLPEATRQLILEDSLEFFQVYRGKSGCVRYKSSLRQLKQLHMAGGVSASAQLLADVAGYPGSISGQWR